MFGQRGKNQQGFTLIEVMMVILSLGMLASMAQAKYRKLKVSAYRNEALVNLNYIKTLTQAFEADNNIVNATGGVPADINLSDDDDGGDCGDINYCNNANEIGFKVLDCLGRRYDYRFSTQSVYRARAEEIAGGVGKCNPTRAVFVGCSVLTYDRWQLGTDSFTVTNETDPTGVCLN